MMKTWLTSLLFTSFIVAVIATVTAAEPQGKTRISETSPVADSDVTRVTGQLTHIEG